MARGTPTRAPPDLLDNPGTDMQITRNALDANAGVADWFTDSVFIDTVTTPPSPSRLGAALVHFTPGARTAWHTHLFGQTIFVTEGTGLCQREGWADRAHQTRREPLARAAHPVHDPPRHAGGRRLRQPRDPGRARQRRALQRRPRFLIGRGQASEPIEAPR